MGKCWGELLSIFMYLIMVGMMVVILVHHIRYGKPVSCLIEVGFALIIDQIKHIPMQLIIWWTVIRRCGKFDAAEFEEWEDDTIALGGTDMSLFQFMRHSVKLFLENRYISQLILGMTLFLCVVIFSELSIKDYLVDENG